MKLVSFSAHNYRSITQANKLPIYNSTILIGPNNEGKSNILRALVAALRVVGMLGDSMVFKGRLRTVRGMLRIYDWTRDFPISLQQSNPDGESVFNLEFELTDKEVSDFWEEVKSNLNGTLPIQITLGKKEPGFKVTKKGPGALALTKKAEAIARFIGNRLNFEYIPAVRTAQSALEVVTDMVDRELSKVEGDEAYKQALVAIKNIQAPVLKKISEVIKGTLQEFLTAVKDVRVDFLEEERSRALRHSYEIVIDDGTPTNLKHKGDGVQSLAALSLMRHASEKGSANKHLILAIEEPESHLHPKAIHQLKSVLQEIAEKHQIIMTSHCPLFVNRGNIQSNIIVATSKAKPAKNIREIRDILGVKAADNLINAEIVLLVEGEDDRKALKALFASASNQLKAALSNGTIVIDSLMGGYNLSYKLSQMRDLICQTHVFMDHDKAGIDAARVAHDEGLLLPSDLHYATCDGMKESEIEDIYDFNAYKSAIESAYGITLNSPKFKTSQKWSDRLRAVFLQQGKTWNDNVEMKVKELVATQIVSNPATAINVHKRSAFDALVSSLEKKINKA